jgi:hypothetical protein
VESVESLPEVPNISGTNPPGSLPDQAERRHPMRGLQTLQAGRHCRWSKGELDFSMNNNLNCKSNLVNLT